MSWDRKKCFTNDPVNETDKRTQYVRFNVLLIISIQRCSMFIVQA